MKKTEKIAKNAPEFRGGGALRGSPAVMRGGVRKGVRRMAQNSEFGGVGMLEGWPVLPPIAESAAGVAGGGPHRCAATRAALEALRSRAVAWRAVPRWAVGRPPVFLCPVGGVLAAEIRGQAADVACLTKKVLDKALRCVHNTAALLLT